MLTLSEIQNIQNLESNISKKIKNYKNIYYKSTTDEEKNFLQFIEDESKKANINLDKVFDKKNDSPKKTLEKLKYNNDEKIRIFFKELITKISIKFPQYSNQAKSLLNEEKIDEETEKFYKNFHRTLSQSKKNVNSELRKNKQEGESYFKRFKTEVGEVNLNGINSKTIEHEIEQYIKLLTIMKEELIPLEKKIEELQSYKLVLIALSATFGITSGALSIASFFVPPLLGVSLLYGVAATICGLISSTLQGIIQTYNKKIIKIVEIIKNFEKLNFSEFGIIDFLSIGQNLLGLAQSILSWQFPTRVFNNISGGIFSLLNAAFDIKSCIDTTNDLKNTIENQKITYKKMYQINDYLSKAKLVKWVVVDETKQTDEYWRGGIGGKNLKFKNLETKKIFTLKELLSYTKMKLNLLGLTKVYNSHLKEWYIKTLPNKSLMDNLG